MSDPIPLHPDDLDTVLEHMLTVGAEARDPHVPDLSYGFEDLPEEVQADWRRWVQAACAGAPARACNMGMATWTAARGMARALAERRQRAEVDARLLAGTESITVGDVQAYYRDDVEEEDGEPTWELRADGDARWVPRAEAMARLRREAEKEQR